MLSTFKHIVLTLSLLTILINSQSIGQAIFNPIDPNPNLRTKANQLLKEANHFDVDLKLLYSTLNTTTEIEMDLPIGQKLKSFVLKKVNILTPDYKLYTSSICSDLYG